MHCGPQDSSHFSWRMMTHSVQFMQCSFSIVPNDGNESPPTVRAQIRLIQTLELLVHVLQEGKDRHSVYFAY